MILNINKTMFWAWHPEHLPLEAFIYVCVHATLSKGEKQKLFYSLYYD